jgi:hypothetical protein
MKKTEKLPPELRLVQFIAKLFMAIINHSPWRRRTAKFLVGVSDIFVPVNHALFSAYYELEYFLRRRRTRAAYWWHCHIRCTWWAWCRWSGRPWRAFRDSVCGLYIRRVVRPITQWELQGSPLESLPSLPWWHGLIWALIVICRWPGRVHPTIYTRSGKLRPRRCWRSY